MSLETPDRILAAVVTYHPGDDLDGNLAALRAELPDVVVIDNGSPASFEVARRAAAAGCRYIANGENLGMPAALNRAARIVLSEGYGWLACFDQDTRINPGVFDVLKNVYAAHPARERIAILAMSHRDRITGRRYDKPWHTLARGAGWRSLRSTISSGMLVRAEAIEVEGAFDERLFMDWFDHDLCLRARRGGWLVIEGEEAVIAHSIGDMTPMNVLGFKRYYSLHSAPRNYYITRDSLTVVFRHLAFDPRYCLAALAILIAGRPLEVAMGPHRLAKAGANLAGARDFLLRRSGRRS